VLNGAVLMVVVSITPEIYLEGLKTYAGGLGVLEGDKFYAAGDMGLEYLVLTLMYRHGYVDVEFRGEEPVIKPQKHGEEAMKHVRPGEEFKIVLRGEEVYVQPWIYEYRSAKAVLFEAVCPTWARKLTEQVYIEDSVEQQFLRYALLAKASGYYIKNVIGVENVSVIDLQEAHTALALFTISEHSKFRFVIHTPGPWGHPGFPGDYIAREFGVFLGDYVSLTRFALSKLGSAIVVSQKQRDVLSKIFPEYASKFTAITNGIYLERWMHPVLYSAFAKGDVDANVIARAREEGRRNLEKLLANYKDVEIGDKPVIAWTRRLARYKRPYFIAKFIEEHPETNAVFILGGKPHPRDADGLNYAMWFRKLHLRLRNVVFIHDYDVEKAKLVFQGSDILLFTPFSGWEACGTSYMKALVNGVPVVSSRDGGVVEIVRDGVHGWLFGEDIRDFINIYGDHRALDIDNRDYVEFKSKLLNAVKLVAESRDKYYAYAVNAVRDIPGKVDVKAVLKKYYLSNTAS